MVGIHILNNSLANQYVVVGLLHLQSWESSCAPFSPKRVRKTKSLSSDLTSIQSSSSAHLQMLHYGLGCYCASHTSSSSKNRAATAVSKGSAYSKKLFTSLSETRGIKYGVARDKLGSHCMLPFGASWLDDVNIMADSSHIDCLRSFSQILKCDQHFKNFHTFLERQGEGVENLLSFWMAVERMKDVLDDEKKCATRVQQIMTKFFSKTSSLSMLLEHH